MYLEVHLDQTLSMKQHINSLCCAAFHAIRTKCFDSSDSSGGSTAKLVSSMVTSRLHYCNATFVFVANEQIASLQKIQNNTAWLVIQKIEARSYDITFERTPPAPEYMLSMTLMALSRHICPLLSLPTNHHIPSILQQNYCSRFQTKI